MHREPGKAARGVSRRSFIRQAAASAGVVAAGSAASEADQSPRQNISRDTARTSSTTPPPSGSKAPVSEIQFPMTGGASICPGLQGRGPCGAVLLPRQLRRHSRDCQHRHPGLFGTPGFTDMIGGIAGANAARAPLLVVASNMALFQEDTEAGIQLAYQQPTTDGMKKYGKRLVTPSRVPEYTAYAFRQLRSSVPRPSPKQIDAAVQRLRSPVIVIVYNNNAWGTWTGASEP